MNTEEYFKARRRLSRLAKEEKLFVGELEVLMIMGDKGLLPSKENVLDIDPKKIDSGSITSVWHAYKDTYSETACPTVTNHIKNLKRKGFVRKEINPRSERQKYVELTEEGQRIYLLAKCELETLTL